MFRSTLKKLARTLTTSSRCPARAMSSRPALAVEGLEDRMVLSTASLVGSTLQVTADAGRFVVSRPRGPLVARFRTITFQVDHATSSKLDVLDGNTLLGK